MEKKELEKKVADLERRVRELEAQPKEQHNHYHFDYYPPVYVNPPAQLNPLPIEPYRVTCNGMDISPSNTGGLLGFSAAATNVISIKRIPQQ